MVADNQGHLDRRVPISIIIAILVQLVVGVWQVSKLDNRVSNLELAENRAEVSVARSETATADENNRLIRVEDKLSEIAEGIKRLEKTEGK